MSETETFPKRTHTWTRWLLFVIAVFATSSLRAQDVNGDGWVQILLPIAIPSTRSIPGAHGSLWTQELWVANQSTNPFFALQQEGLCQSECTPSIPAGRATQWLAVRNNGFEGGALFALRPAVAAGMRFSSRLLELSRRAQPNGIDIPLVREDEFFREQTSFLGIPAGPQVRSRLRVYDPRLQRGSTVLVEIVAFDGAVIGSTTLSPGNDPAIPDAPRPTFEYPGFAVIPDLNAAFPQIRAGERFHVRLTPQTPGMEYWAFVSLTDVETQHVLLITSR